MVVSSEPPQQRWDRPLDMPPGCWKTQLATKYLEIGRRGNVDALRKLLAEHPEFLNQHGSHNRTLLWEAARNGKLGAVIFLRDQGADVNATGCYHSETMVQITPYCAAVYYERPAIATYLSGLCAPHDIFRAAFLDDEKRVAAMLADQPDLLNAEDDCDMIYYFPLITFAVAGGNADLVADLLRRGADVAQYSAQLFHIAAKAGRMDLVELLASNGADVRTVDSGDFASVSDLSILRYFLDPEGNVFQISDLGNTAMP
jgi:ankyrin repeat protein